MHKVTLAIALTAILAQPAAAATAAVATGAVNVRSGPGTGYEIMDTLVYGERVSVTECEGNWCYVRHPGPDGWVSARYLTRAAHRTHWHDPCDVDPSTDFHMRFGLYHSPLAKYCRERDD